MTWHNKQASTPDIMFDDVEFYYRCVGNIDIDIPVLYIVSIKKLDIILAYIQTHSGGELEWVRKRKKKAKSMHFPSLRPKQTNARV